MEPIRGHRLEANLYEDMSYMPSDEINKIIKPFCNLGDVLE